MSAGLGNRLLPWARARVWANRHGARLVSPRWFNPKLGPLLRGESDARLYHNLFRPAPGDMSGLKSTLIQWRAPKYEEPADLAAPAKGDGLYVFSGYGDYFASLGGEEATLERALRAITRPQWLAEVDALPPRPLAMHVRLGDFAVPANAGEMHSRGGVRTPIAWFIETLRHVRGAAGGRTPVNLFSDGRPEELAPLLAEGDVHLVSSSNAICGLLGLSRGKVLIATGGSSFGAWASFMRGMPTVSHPGQDMAWFGLKRTPDRFVGAFDPSAPDQDFLSQAARACAV